MSHSHIHHLSSLQLPVYRMLFNLESATYIMIQILYAGTVLIWNREPDALSDKQWTLKSFVTNQFTQPVIKSKEKLCDSRDSQTFSRLWPHSNPALLMTYWVSWAFPVSFHIMCHFEAIKNHCSFQKYSNIQNQLVPLEIPAEQWASYWTSCELFL